MPIDDTNDKLWAVINPAGVIAGMKAGLIPALNFVLEHTNAEDVEGRVLVVQTYTLLGKWVSFLAKFGAKGEYLKDYSKDHPVVTTKDEKMAEALKEISELK